MDTTRGDFAQVLRAAGAGGLTTWLLLRVCAAEQNPLALASPSFWLGTIVVCVFFAMLLGVQGDSPAERRGNGWAGAQKAARASHSVAHPLSGIQIDVLPGLKAGDSYGAQARHKAPS